MDEISDVEAQNNLPALLDRVERGGELVITRDGRPVARLVGPSSGTEAAEARGDLSALRASMKTRGSLLTIEEIIAYRDEGRR